MMSKPLILVIDQGTFSTRALVFNAHGALVASASRKIHLQRISPAMVEQNADEILASVNEVITAVLKDKSLRKRDIGCAGLATQRSSVTAWNRRTGKSLAPVLSWQDRREAQWLETLQPHAAQIKNITGLPLSPYYGASKLRWFLHHLPKINPSRERNELIMGPLTSFILFHLLKGTPCVVDHANASRTQLWNLATRNWDPFLSEVFDVPLKLLPQCYPIRHAYGTLQTAEIPLTAVNGDQNAAIYALGQPAKNTAIVNIGTGAFILFPTEKTLVPHPTLLSGLSSSDSASGEYTLEGTINGAGAALKWLAKTLKILDLESRLADWLREDVDPPIFINSIGGLGSPWWQAGPAPVFLGEGDPGQKTIAVLESILFLLMANIEEMEKCVGNIERLQISGGLSRLDGLCQKLADLTGKEVLRPAETEATSRGIAWLAAGSPTLWPSCGQTGLFRSHHNPMLQKRYSTFRKVLVDKIGVAASTI